MKVTILGSGTCVPSLARSSCSVLVRMGTDALLFDSGPGTMRRLLRAGLAIDDISILFYSHLHPDHTAEFVPWLFATKYPKNLRRRPLTIIAATGFVRFYEKLKQAYGDWIVLPPHILDIVELDTHGPGHLDFGAFKVASLPMAHTDESLGYRITAQDGTSIVYSGDTDVCENLVTLAREATVLICESALPDAMKVAGHLTPSLAGELATRAGVKKLVLTHFYPECDAVDIAAECRKTYQGPLVLAEDLLEFEIP
ncbi:MAG: MBL fold metallo-hydrolase [Deltaproteobacteria bacterium]|nr:MBL fold metallo-hydrolase [Deltaproteobacteria bacterium]